MSCFHEHGHELALSLLYYLEIYRKKTKDAKTKVTKITAKNLRMAILISIFDFIQDGCFTKNSNLSRKY